MVYESALNESDYALKRQLDEAKLGSGVRGETDIVTADAAWATLPEKMAVANIMEKRASLGLHTQQMGRNMAEDERKRREADEFSAFSDEIQGLTPGDVVGNAEKLADLSKRNIGNKDIQDAINSASQNDLRVFNAKRNAFAGRKEDDEQVLYAKTKDANERNLLIQQENIQKQNALTTRNLDRLTAEGSVLDETSIGEVGSSLASIDTGLSDALANFNVGSKNADLDDSIRRKAFAALSVYGESKGLEDIAGASFENAKNELATATFLSGVDPSTLTREDFVARFPKKILPAKAARLLSAHSDVVEFQSHLKTRMDIGEKIKSALNMPLDTEENRNAFSKNLESLYFKFGAIKGEVDKLKKDKDLSIANRKLAIEAQDAIDKHEATRATIDDKKFKRAEAVLTRKLREKGMNDLEIYRKLLLKKPDRLKANSPAFEEWVTSVDKDFSEGDDGTDAFAEDKLK